MYSFVLNLKFSYWLPGETQNRLFNFHYLFVFARVWLHLKAVAGGKALFLKGIKRTCNNLRRNFIQFQRVYIGLNILWRCQKL